MAAYYGFGRSSGYAGMVYGSLLWVSVVMLVWCMAAYYGFQWLCWYGVWQPTMGLVGPVVMLVWCMAAYYGFGRSSGYAGMVYGSLLWVW